MDSKGLDDAVGAGQGAQQSTNQEGEACCLEMTY
jgi:hypothetical protein